jgi:hypothetical protein
MPGDLLYSIVGALLVAGAGVPLLVGHYRKLKPLKVHKSEAVTHFTAWLESSAAAQLGLSPKNCEIVQ